MKTYKIIPYTGSRLSPCFDCPIYQLCHESLDDNGELKIEFKMQMHHIPEPNATFLNYALVKAKECKKSGGKYIIEEKSTNQHVLVSRSGKEILRSDSFLGMIGSTILTCLLTMIAVALIGGVICGLASLFS